MTKKRTFKNLLLPFIKKHPIWTLLLAFAVLAVSLSSLLPPFVLQHILDDYLSPALNGQSYDSNRLIWMTMFYFGSYLLIGILTLAENFLVDTIGQKIIRQLRHEMIEKSHRLSSSYFRHNGTGVMTSRVMDDVSSIETLFSDGLVSLLVSLFKIIGILISVFVFSYVLGFIVLAIIPLVYFITNAFRKRMLKNQLRSRKLKNDETNNLSESIDNMRTLENLEKKEYRENNFVSLQKEDIQVSHRSAIYDSLFSPIVMMLRAVVIGVVTLLVAFSLSSEMTFAGLSVGTFAAAIALISNIFAPIQELGQELQVMQEGVSGITRVLDYMNQPEDVEANKELKAEDIFLQKEGYPFIEAKNLSFHYEDGEEKIFDNVSFVINEKDKVSVVGRTGAGKTTLFRLLLSILYPTEGEILFCGQDVKYIPNKEKRKIFGYVEQGFKGIPGTIEEQITLKDKSISLEEVRQAMKQVRLDDYVMEKIKDNYQATFKEDNFSRGQLQLLNLARALVTNPPVLLLDEISANLDSETEKEIIEAISLASSQRTVISISHRLSDQLGFTKTLRVVDGKVSFTQKE